MFLCVNYLFILKYTWNKFMFSTSQPKEKQKIDICMSHLLHKKYIPKNTIYIITQLS